MSFLRAIRPKINRSLLSVGPSSIASTRATQRVDLRCRSNTATIYASERDLPDQDKDFGYYDIIIPKEPFVWGVSHIKPLAVPNHIQRPKYALPNGNDPDADEMKNRAYGGYRKINKGEDEEKLRTTARLASEVLEYAGSLVQVGVTTNDVDAKVHEYILSHSAYPSPLLYKGFPKSCCTSINNVITHGIPDERPLQDGDILNIDITIYKNGFHGDTSQTFLVGNVDEKGQELVHVTRDALEAGISACGPGRPLKGIAQAIHESLRGRDFCVSSQFSGHGIGEDFHRPPWILHHLNEEPGTMEPGLCFTIEPCIIQGSDPHGWMFPDGWTVSTENCARSAQAEHMVLITDKGADVLTRTSNW